MTSPVRRLGSTAGARRRPPVGAPIGAARRRRHLAERSGRRPSQLIATIAVSVLIALTGVAGTVSIIGAGVVGLLSAGLPDPATLDSLTFDQPTILYDRTGTVELARFEAQDRRVVSFADIPPLVLDATTTAEDRTFWDNQGFDPAAMIAAFIQDLGGGSSDLRGASTITQQLVRSRLLPPGIDQSGDRFYRKALEVIQAGRLTSAFPGEAGKDKIITAYLNDIYYGHEAYGIAAAAQTYFGISDLSKLTPAQAALLAGLPKAPSTYDPYRYAKKDGQGRLVLPADSPPVVRRDYILSNLNTSKWTRLSPSELQAALDEPVVLAGVKTEVMRAPPAGP